MSLITLWKYLNRTNKIKPLPHDLTTPYDPLTLDWDTLLVLMTARARDPQAVERLMKKHNADSAVTLIPRLPPRRAPSLKVRIRTWLQRMEGSYATDPYKMELRRARRQSRRIPGYSETRIPVRVRIKNDRS